MIDRILAIAGVFGWAMVAYSMVEKFWSIDPVVVVFGLVSCATAAAVCVVGFGKLNG